MRNLISATNGRHTSPSNALKRYMRVGTYDKVCTFDVDLRVQSGGLRQHVGINPTLKHLYVFTFFNFS